MLDAAGNTRGLLSLGQDVTEEERLHEEVLESYKRIQRVQHSSIFALAKLAESRDGETGNHLTRIQKYCRVLCQTLRTREKYRPVLTSEFIEYLVQSAILHDIGKVAIPDSILFNPGKFGIDEYEVMKQHTLHGGQALEEAAEETGQESFLSFGRDIAYHHHEHWDGKGYPYGLQGEEIPLAARIVALADVYDALTTQRRYKRAYSHQEALSIVLSERERQFDPDIVDAFAEVEHKFRTIREKHSGEARPAAHRSSEYGDPVNQRT
jgi:response regulator RpfG family c-di-GMP phosphodiesterase